MQIFSAILLQIAAEAEEERVGDTVRGCSSVWVDAATGDSASLLFLKDPLRKYRLSFLIYLGGCHSFSLMGGNTGNIFCRQRRQWMQLQLTGRTGHKLDV